MKQLILDTETTSLYPGNICQLSYIIAADGDVAAGKNYYFSVDTMDWRAQNVHGLSLQMLRALSGGNTFSHHIKEITSDLKHADIIIGHNILFDIRFLRHEFMSCGTLFPGKKMFCTMKYFTDIIKIPKSGGRYKYPNLGELARYLGIGDSDVAKACETLFGGRDLRPHDARFDTAAVKLCLDEAEKRGLLPGMLLSR
ncbi:MAG TPA: 3'-5' exonuclease [Spirochaetota bacterium]|nr:3'-5' exonuclease [Spirochaetota bacterium]